MPDILLTTIETWADFRSRFVPLPTGCWWKK